MIKYKNEEERIDKFTDEILKEEGYLQELDQLHDHDPKQLDEPFTEQEIKDMKRIIEILKYATNKAEKTIKGEDIEIYIKEEDE